MSRALPAAERIAGDAYYTPDDVAARLVRVLDLTDDSVIVEPSAGGGAFVRAIWARHLTNVAIFGCDVNKDAAGLALCSDHMACDFTSLDAATVDALIAPADWVIGNPPFTHAEAHVRHALTLAPRCAFLLRLAFLESAKRVDFWRDHQPAVVYVLANRPSFTGGGTDSAAYGWFVWDRTQSGPTRLEVLSLDGPLWGGR